MILRTTPLLRRLKAFIGLAAICIFPSSHSCAQNTAEADYFSYVNWQYQHRNDLIGWKNTEELIRQSLKGWGFTVQVNQSENSGITELAHFQQRVVSHSSSGLKLVYVASHQTPSGRMDFPDKNKVHWSDGFSHPSKVSGTPSILVLDVCHADVIPQVRMNQSIPFQYILSACAANEETYELRMFARRPVDFKRRYPAEVAWMQEKLGPKWKGEVSFTGFIWVRQFLKSPGRPISHAEWKQFLSGMEQEAAIFAKERSRYLSSTLKLWK